ncbi:MAG TPA: PQQ-binding-like beta-propeller repeat protein [Pirellulales bacterium]|nr:PQQ-binding-like beta-propeller repeat protein [Pirellulales bacterium]
MRSSIVLVLALLLGPICLCSRPAAADDWPQWRGPTRDGVWRETGVVEKFASPQIKIRWRVPISSGYSGPTVADGRVYVTDRVAEPEQIERVHCFDAKTGEPVWSHSYDCVYHDVSYTAGPRASVTIDEGRAYALGTMGDFFCFDAASGEILWQHHLDEEYKIRMPIWGLAASPLVEQGLVIVQVSGEGDACLVAFDKQTGEERWRSMKDDASYAAPIMTKQAGRPVMICWTGQHVAGLDASTGKVYWEYPFKPSKMVLSIATPVIERDRLFVTGFYDGSLMLKLDPKKLAVEKLWRRVGRDENHTDSLQSLISTPYLKGDYVYGVDSNGELRCLEAETGDRLWEQLPGKKPVRWFTIHMVENHGKIWMFNERGELVITRLSPKGYEEISRAKLIAPTREQLNERGGVCWAHPAFADRHVFARNDEELVAADLSAAGAKD